MQAKPLSRLSASARQQPQAVNIATNLRSKVKTQEAVHPWIRADEEEERHRSYSALARPNT